MSRFLKAWLALFILIGIGGLVWVDAPGEDLMRGAFVASFGLVFVYWLCARLQ